MVIGDPMDDSTELGALISKEHLKKVEYHISLAKEEVVKSRRNSVRTTGSFQRKLDGSYSDNWA